MFSKRLFVTKRSILYSFLLLPFFEPLLIDVLLARYPNEVTWSLISCLFKISELVIAAYVYFSLFFSLLWKKTFSRVNILLILHLVLMIVSCFVKMEIAVTFFGSTFCTIALVFLSESMIRKSEEDFLKAGRILFGSWSAYAIISAFLFPNGFVESTTKYNAIFGLGAKNNAFPFFFAYIYFLFADEIKKNKRLPFYVPIVVAGMVVAAVIYTSVNTMICIGLIWGVYLINNNYKLFFKRQNIFVWLTALVIVISTIYVGMNLPIMEKLLAKLGRNITFSHRDVIWSHALSYLKNNPIFGAGANIKYRTVWSGEITRQAHSQYLDKLAKFGILPFIFLVAAIIKIFGSIRKCNDKNKMNLLATMLLIYMFHMAFDTYNYNFYIIIIIILNSFVHQNLRQCKSKNE